MSLTNQRNKDKAMAAHLRANGVQRTTLACSICHRVIGVTSYQTHLLTHMGGRS